ncbi:MAG TPA: hypothetical protein VNZ44_11835 [Pyrinomonadaceae bacterium]|nr:hypothetical protein [Pyrinomonadaceae bacterium]
MIEKSTPEGKVVYDVAYAYEFKGRGAVYVKGLGTVPAKGKFSYLTSDQQLEFKESAEGLTLATVRLEETVRTMGGDSTDIPKESDFPQAFRSSTWSPPATFAESAVKILQKYFPSGYSPRQAGQLNFYVTTYRSLQVPSLNLRSQIAVIVSQPYDAVTDRFTYRVQFVARDRPKLSDTWRYGDDRDQQTITAAQQFVDKLIQELTPTGGQPR